MKKKFISAAILIAASAFAAQAAATTSLDFQGHHNSNINNQWFNTGDLSNLFHGIAPYTKATSDGLGSATVSPITNVASSNHIHVSGSASSSTPTVPFIHGDVGGIFISGAGSHSTFSLQSMDILAADLRSNIVSPNATVTVRGFLGGFNGMIEGVAESDGLTMLYKGGTQVASATITEADLGSGSNAFNFLAANSGFAEVDYVEFFFTDFYRRIPSSLGDTALLFEFDNIVVGTPVVSAVPVPAAVWLFGTGIIGLVSFGKRKQATIAA